MDESKLSLQKIILKTVEIFNPYQIWLFGSFARGDFQEESDLNILIIAEEDIKYRERIKKSSELSSLFENICISPIVYTKKEIDELRKIHHPFIESVFEEGELIYE